MKAVRTGLMIGLAMLVLGPAPSLAQPMRGCRPDDAICRADQIDRRLDAIDRRLSEILRRLDEAQAPPPPPRLGVDVPANTWCTGESCNATATRLCKESGFNRGVPKTISDSQKLLWITCLD